MNPRRDYKTGTADVLCADAGYYSEANVQLVAHTRSGWFRRQGSVDRLLEPGRLLQGTDARRRCRSGSYILALIPDIKQALNTLL